MAPELLSQSLSSIVTVDRALIVDVNGVVGVGGDGPGGGV